MALAGYRRVRLVGPALADLGEPVAGETDLTAKVRGLPLGLMAIQGGDDEARAAAKLRAWEVDRRRRCRAGGLLDGDRRQHRHAADYEKMLAQYRSGDTPQVQSTLYLLPSSTMPS